MRMTEDDEATSTPTAKAYAELQDWMVGARMDSIRQDRGTWICQLNRDGRNTWVVWNPDRKSEFNRPKGDDTIRTLSGETSRISGNRIEVGPTPVLVEKSAH